MYDRMARISEGIKRELSALMREVKDPLVSDMVVIVRVEVTRDLSMAKVYVSALDDRSRLDAVRGLKRASSFLRKRLGNLRLRVVPKLYFIPDYSMEYGVHMENVIKKTNRVVDNVF